MVLFIKDLQRLVPGALPMLPVILTFRVHPHSEGSTGEEVALVSGRPDGNAGPCRRQMFSVEK